MRPWSLIINQLSLVPNSFIDNSFCIRTDPESLRNYPLPRPCLPLELMGPTRDVCRIILDFAFLLAIAHRKRYIILISHRVRIPTRKHSIEAAYMKSIRTIISCSSSVFCEGMAAQFEKEDDIEIIGKIEDGSQAIKCLSLKPDVFILDPLLFRSEEVQRVVQELKLKSPRTRILLLFLETAMSDRCLMQCMVTGVAGYINRDVKLQQIVEAVRTIHAGNIWAERRLLDKFVRYAPLLVSSDLESKLSKLENPLTQREKDITSLLFLGLPNKHISHKLHISEKTVKTHLNNIFKKMKVSSRTQVVVALINSY